MRPSKFKTKPERENDRLDAASKEAFAELQAKANKLRAEGKFKSSGEKRDWIRKEWAAICDVPFVPRKKVDEDTRVPAGMTSNEDTDEPDDDQMGRVGRAKPEVLPLTHKELAEAKA